MRNFNRWPQAQNHFKRCILKTGKLSKVIKDMCLTCKYLLQYDLFIRIRNNCVPISSRQAACIVINALMRVFYLQWLHKSIFRHITLLQCAGRGVLRGSYSPIDKKQSTVKHGWEPMPSSSPAFHITKNLSLCIHVTCAAGFSFLFCFSPLLSWWPQGSQEIYSCKYIKGNEDHKHRHRPMLGSLG